MIKRSGGRIHIYTYFVLQTELILIAFYSWYCFYYA